MTDPELATAVADATLAVLERGDAITDRFVVATAELARRVAEFLAADRAYVADPSGDTCELMAAGRRLSAARLGLDAAVAWLPSGVRVAALHHVAPVDLPAVELQPHLEPDTVQRGWLARAWDRLRNGWGS